MSLRDKRLSSLADKIETKELKGKEEVVVSSDKKEIKKKKRYETKK